MLDNFAKSIEKVTLTRSLLRVKSKKVVFTSRGEKGKRDK